MNQTEMVANATTRFFVAHSVDQFNREWSFWSVWYRNRQGRMRQTGDEPFYLRWNAERYARRYNKALDAIGGPKKSSPENAHANQSAAQ